MLSLLTGMAVASMVGGESGAYLRYPVGATALAMGGAQTASHSALAAWWNPAMLTRRKTRNAALGFGFRSLGQTDGFASLGFRIPPRMGMGFLLLYRGDPFLNDLYDENENPLEPAAFTSLTGKIALSYYISRHLSAGCNISILFEQIPSDYTDGRVHYSSATSIGSFDFALAYKWSHKLMLSLVLKDAGATLNWNFQSYYDYGIPHDDKVFPSFIFGSRYTGTLRERPLIWNMDLRGYFFTGEWKKAERPQLAVANGLEWQYWKTVFLRMGLGELLINGDITGNNPRYRRDFSFRFTGGIAVDLQKVRPGLRLNYGFSTDKVWAGIDQQLDITYTF